MAPASVNAARLRRLRSRLSKEGNVFFCYYFYRERRKSSFREETAVKCQRKGGNVIQSALQKIGWKRIMIFSLGVF